MKLFKNKFQAGFTLIELLVVIAVLGILSTAVLVAINPLSKINAAKDSTVKSDIAQIVSALQSYYTLQLSPSYPLTQTALAPTTTGLAALKLNDLKSLPIMQSTATACAASPDGTPLVGPTGAYCYVVSATGDKAAIFGSLFSTAGSYWCWDSTDGVYKTSASAPTQASPICP